MMTIQGQIANILGTTEKNLPSRVLGLRLGNVCSRCGGSGKFSFNQIHGDTCYGCGGNGLTMPKSKSDLQTLLKRAEDTVSSGKLAEYLHRLQIEKKNKGVVSRIMKAWRDTGIERRYDWMEAVRCSRIVDSGETPSAELLEHRRIADLNSIMCNAYETVSKIANLLTYTKRSDSKYDAMVLELANKSDDAFRIIAETAKLM